MSTKKPTLILIDGHALAYLDSDLSTTVHQMDGTTGMIKSSTPTSGRLIVGAGVSTCAPVVIF